MSQAQAQRLISKLRFNLHDRRNLRNPEGPKGRHDKIRKTVTALIKYERIELNYHRADECRGYAERLISDAIRHGACHTHTMDMASYWLLEPQLVHKLFKVLVPRYQNCPVSYTKLWKAPNRYPGHGRPKSVLELRYNIFPPLGESKVHNKNQIHNVLLDAAREYYAAQKQAAKQTEANAAESSEAKSEQSVDSNEMNLAKNVTEDNLGNNESKAESGETVSDVEKDLGDLKLSEENEKTTSGEEEKK